MLKWIVVIPQQRFFSSIICLDLILSDSESEKRQSEHSEKPTQCRPITCISMSVNSSFTIACSSHSRQNRSPGGMNLRQGHVQMHFPTPRERIFNEQAAKE